MIVEYSTPIKMPSLRKAAKCASVAIKSTVNWHPGHMYSGMQAMIGKLFRVDCVIEVHDARIPLIGRNREFRKHLGSIKPHILVLNKADLADLSDWDNIEKKLKRRGDQEVLLTDLSGSEFSYGKRGYDKLLQRAVDLISGSDRLNRAMNLEYKIMVVGIPNVGKSTLINRLRQHHLGLKGEATKTGKDAGVTKHVENKIKICARPLVYSLDTPGVLQPSATKNETQAMQLALCSAINDKVLNPVQLVDALLNHLHSTGNYSYVDLMGLQNPATNAFELCERIKVDIRRTDRGSSPNLDLLHVDRICWRMVKLFREGRFGKVLFL